MLSSSCKLIKVFADWLSVERNNFENLIKYFSASALRLLVIKALIELSVLKIKCGFICKRNKFISFSSSSVSVAKFYVECFVSVVLDKSIQNSKIREVASLQGAFLGLSLDESWAAG